MKLLNSISLKRKQTLIILLTCSAALLLACAGFTVYDVLSFRVGMRQQLGALGGLLSDNCAAALEFDNPKVATEVLSALRMEPGIVAARIYKDGKVFASYTRSGTPVMGGGEPLPQAGCVFERDRVKYLHALGQPADNLGMIYLESDLSALTENFRQCAELAAFLLLLSLAVAWLLSAWLQRFISGPILRLVQAAREVGGTKNYNVRVSKQGNDELGELIDNFNEMLVQIQARDAAMQRIHEDLEIRVTERTRELQQAYDTLRATQQAVMQQERLGALGQMASGIAHDINNALSPIVLGCDLMLLVEPNLKSESRRNLEAIKTSTRDIVNTVARMKDFYRKRDPQEALTLCDLGALANQAVELARPRWRDIPQQRGAVINLHTDFQPGLPSVAGNESEIRQSLMNLIFNAADAMPGGGNLSLRTRLVRKSAAAEAPGAADWVCLEISDTGIGMNEETRKRCLEPFFSTKGPRGTGMGLSVVYGIMERHGGAIEMESAEGKGTTVRLLFPVAANAARGGARSEAAAPVASLRILCVDDEPAVLELLRRALSRVGHQVTACENGEAGVEAFRQARLTGQPFEAVISDLGMPGMDGRAVANAIKELSPATPVILLTGWGMFMQSQGDQPANVDLILNKPATLDDLTNALRSLAAKPTT